MLAAQYSTDGQKRHRNLAPVLLIIQGKCLAFSRKIITPVLVFTGAAPRRVRSSSGKKIQSPTNLKFYEVGVLLTQLHRNTKRTKASGRPPNYT